MDWEDALRLLTFIALAAGAWQSWKAMPPPVRARGRRYWRGPKGFHSIWGWRVRDPVLQAELEAAERQQAERSRAAAGSSPGSSDRPR